MINTIYGNHKMLKSDHEYAILWSNSSFISFCRLRIFNTSCIARMATEGIQQSGLEASRKNIISRLGKEIISHSSESLCLLNTVIVSNFSTYEKQMIIIFLDE
jgi:hypothetical protein